MYIEEKIIHSYLFRLDSFNAHFVLFSLQNFKVTEAIVSLKDLSVSKSHLNCLTKKKKIFLLDVVLRCF